MKKRKLFTALIATLFCLTLFAGCGKGDTGTATLKDVYQAVKDAYGADYKPDASFTEDQIAEQFGVTKEMYEEIYAEGPMISVHADRFIAAKAAKGKSDELKQALENYRQRLIDDNMQYPSNIELVHASKVVQKGDLVFYVLLGEISMDVQESGDDAAVMKAAEEQIAIGVDAIEKAFQ